MRSLAQHEPLACRRPWRCAKPPRDPSTPRQPILAAHLAASSLVVPTHCRHGLRVRDGQCQTLSRARVIRRLYHESNADAEGAFLSGDCGAADSAHGHCHCRRFVNTHDVPPGLTRAPRKSSAGYLPPDYHSSVSTVVPLKATFRI